MPKVSICIPTFGQVTYLRRTLSSISIQRYTDYELIISDDSPDDSVEILLRSFDFGGRLRYNRNKIKLGSPENWNEAIRLADGEYIKLLHHDDYLVNQDSLQKFVELLDLHPNVGFGFCASLVYDVANGGKELHIVRAPMLADLRKNPVILFNGNFVGIPSVTIYRKEISFPYDIRLKWLVDIDFYIRVLLAGSGFCYTEEALIVATSNADHQVTKYCRDNETVELQESMLLFSKIFPIVGAIPEMDKKWCSLFDKYHIYSLAALRKYSYPYPDLINYFLGLLYRFRRKRFLSLHGLRRQISTQFPGLSWTKRILLRKIRCYMTALGKSEIESRERNQIE
jgi:glycosyltransferase involved in cell wall biosynthesis